MIKWEYCVHQLSAHTKPDQLEYSLNELGENGWELVSEMVDGWVLVFKRRKQVGAVKVEGECPSVSNV